MDKYAGLASLFDPSVGSGDAALDELIGIRPYTAKEREEDKRRELADIEAYMGGEARPMQGDGEQNLAYARRYLEAKGFPAHIAAGAVGNFAQESSGISGGSLNKEGGLGIAQWRKERLYGGGGYEGLIPFAKRQGRSPQDLTTQLDYFVSELQGPERAALEKAMQTRTPEQAAVILGRYYERPNEQYANYENRAAQARRFAAIPDEQIQNAPSGMYLDVTGGRPFQQRRGQSPQYSQLETTPMQLSTGQTINVEKGMSHEEVAAMLKKEGIEGVPLRQFQAPNGQTVNAEYDMSDDEVLGMLRKEAPEYATPQGAPTPNKSSYGAAAKESLLTSGAGIFTGLGGETKELGKAVADTELLGQYAKPIGEAITGAGESMRGYGEELGHRAEGVFEMPKDASWFEKTVGYPIVQTGAGIVPYAAAYAIPGVGPATGTAALYGGAMGGLEERAKETGKEFVPSEARPYAVGETALDYVGGRLLGPLKKLFSDDVVLGARETIIKAVEKGGIEEAKKLVGSRLGNIAKQVGITDAAFTSSEVAENVIERAYAGQPLFDDSALQEYADTAKQVAGFGGVAGVAQGLGRHHIKATEVARIEEQKATEEALAAQKAAQLAQQTALEEQAVAKAEKRKERQPIEIPEELQGMPYKDAVRYMQMQEAKAQPPVEEVPEPTVQEKPYYEQLGLKARKNTLVMKGLKQLNPDDPSHGPTINAFLDEIEAKNMPRDQQAIDALRTKLNEVQQNAQQVSETGPTDGSGGAQPSVLEEGGDQTISGEGMEPSRQGEQDVEVDDEEPTEKVKAVAEEVPTGMVNPREFMHYKDVTKRTAELTQAAEQLAAGEITKEDYAALVNKYKPVTAYRSIPKPASLEEMYNALSKDKVDKIGEASGTLEEGENIGLRLDIPAYRDHGAWVVTVHTPRRGGFAGKPIGYESVAGATDVSFGITEKAALNIAKGSGKATIATMEGKWKPVSPEEAATLGKQYLNDPEWIQVGMDPERHSYFYDRANMEPVTHAEEVLQIGGLVFAKNPTYAPASKFLFSGRGKNPDKGVLSLPIQEFESATDAKDLLNRYVKIATDSRLHDLAKTYLTSPHIAAAKVTFFKQGDKIPRNVKNAFDAAKAGAVTVVGEDGAHLYFKADDPNVFREDNVIHEVTHALTEAALVRNPSARAELTGLSDKISRVLHSNNPKYGKFWDDIIGKDPSETLAYSLTLPSFRQVLSKYDEDGHRLKAKPAAFKGQAPVRTLWQKFVDTLTRLFGLPSKQKQAYDTALNEYLDRKAEYEKQVADYNAQRPMQAKLDSILQELLKTTAAEGVAMPSDTAVKAVYAGKSAVGADLGKLEEAEKRTTAGESAQKVRKDTGWFKGTEGEWRFEIPDDKAEWATDWEKISEASVRGKGLRLEDVLDAPELFAAYPELKGVKFTKRPALFDFYDESLGWFDPATNTLNVTPNNLSADAALGTALHEIQHWVQTKEGFARGGNSNSVRLSNIDSLNKLAKYWARSAPSNYDALNALAMEEQGVPFSKVKSRYNREDMVASVFYAKPYDELTEAQQQTVRNSASAKALQREFLAYEREKTAPIEELKENAGKNAALYERVNNAETTVKLLKEYIADKKREFKGAYDTSVKARQYDLAGKIESTHKAEIEKLETSLDEKKAELIEATDALNDFTSQFADIQHALYKLLAGEREARDVAGRRKLTAEQRRESAPYTAEDIREDEAIIVTGAGADAARVMSRQTPRGQRGLAGKLKDKDFGEKLSEAARDVLTSGRHTSLRSEWLDQSEALGKVTENLPTMVGKKARVDFLASHFAQVGNVIADSIHNGFVKDVGDGSVMTIKDHSLAPEKIFRRVAETGKKELFNEMLVALRGRSIREADIKTKALADDLLTKADELDDYASTLQDKKKRASFTRSAQNLRTLAEKKLEGINYDRGRTEVSEEDIRKAEELERAEPELAREAQNVYDLLRKSVDLLEDSGLIDSKTAKQYREYPNYIPLYKVQDFEEAMIDPKKHLQLIISKMGRGANKLPEIKRQKAHFHEVMVESNILKHIALCTMTAAKNNLNKAAALQMELVGAAEPSRLGKDDPDAVQFRDKGEVKYYTIKDKQALFALQAAQPLINPIFKQLKKVSGVVRGAMVMNPLFWYRQLVREPLTASLVGRTGLVTPFDTLAEITKIAAGKSKRYEDLKRRGIVAAQDVITDPIEFIKYVEKGKGWTTKGIERIKEIHEAVDGATRAVVAERAYQDAISKGLSEEDANNLAAIKAREIINFSKQGRSQNVRVMRATTPFFGAALNGLDVLMKAAMPRKYGRLSKAEAMEARRMFYSRASMIALYTAAYTMASSDDEDYLSTVDRAGNWLVPIGNKDNPFTKISIPYELGFFIKTLPELITLLNMGAISTKKAVTEAGKAAWETVVPPMPTIYAIKPLVEAFINFDFHTQSPIETGSDSRGMIHLRNKKAGELTKAVASKLHDAGIDLETLSPDRMEHIMEGFFGQIWGVTRAVSDYFMYDGPEKPEKILSDLPLIGGAFTKGARDAAVNDFYTVYNNVRDLAESVSKLEKGGDVDTLEKLREDKNYAKYMRANTPLGDKMQAMDNKMQIITRIEKDPTIDAAEKKRRIDIQNEQRNTLAKQGLDIARKLGLEF
jgi:hypothetical protein